MPTITRKGYSAPLVNDKELTDRIANNLTSTGLVGSENMITEFRPVTGSEDAHMLVQGLDGVKIAYIPVGTAPPEKVAKARKEGKIVPFANHQAAYLVDLNAIPFGTKLAAMIVLDLLVK